MMRVFFIKFINLFFIILLILIGVVNILYNIGKYKFYFFITFILFTILLILLYVIIIKFRYYIFNTGFNYKIIIILIFIFKLLFLFLDLDNFSGDTRYNYEIVINNDFNDVNLKLFPFLLPYIHIISILYKVFGDFHFSVIFFNVIIDILSAIIIYIIFNKKLDNNFCFLCVIYFLINPINIAFSSIGLNISLFNLCILIIVYILNLYFKANTNKKYLYACILGIFLGLSNNVRPISIIFIIAIFISISILNFKKHFIVSFVIIVFTFSMSNNFTNKYLYETINYKPVENIGGWNIYVGTNYKYSGRYNLEDSKIFYEKVYGTDNYSNLLTKLKEDGINRYLSYDISKKIILPIKKFAVLVSFARYPYNLSVYSIIEYYEKYINILFFIWGMFVLCASLFKGLKNFKDNISISLCDLFLILLFNGLVTSFLFVEVSNRYFIPMLTILTLYSSDYIYLFLKYLNKKLSILFDKI